MSPASPLGRRRALPQSPPLCVTGWPLADHTEDRFGEHVNRINSHQNADRDSEHVSICERQEVEGNWCPGGTSDKHGALRAIGTIVERPYLCDVLGYG